ncbi:basic secretory protein-like protein [Pedobacter sp. MW01-1-1]|uniref:basic secretory protein-like protein n=1 Tax=Pedobacter sp. MW01-1-1 TaxID=3383027 RepID=UPI003FF0829E
MKKSIFFSLYLLVVLASGTALKAQETIKRGGYTLVFDSNFSGFDAQLKNRMIETFFEVYPKLAKEYNPTTLKKVWFLVDTAYDGVAATANGEVTYGAKYMTSHPGDIDVVTHEVMHIVQDYGNSVGPGWLTEGIADYARYKFGIDNAAAKWGLPPFKPTYSYKNSYSITARFLVWIESKVKAGIVKTLNTALREHTYTPALWASLTGKDVDSLWAEYSKNPEL